MHLIVVVFKLGEFASVGVMHEVESVASRGLEAKDVITFVVFKDQVNVFSFARFLALIHVQQILLSCILIVLEFLVIEIGGVGLDEDTTLLHLGTQGPH